MFEDPKWKPIYIKRQRTKKNKEKEQMTFNNKQELIDKIKEKQESAKNTLEAINRKVSWTIEEGRNNILEKERNKAYINAYEDVIALIDSAKIVVSPEMTSVLQTQKPQVDKSQELSIVAPHSEPKVERLRNDRIREYVDYNKNLHYIDAKEISYIRIDSDNYVGIELRNSHIIWIKKDILDYNELVEWWKYWKQM